MHSPRVVYQNGAIDASNHVVVGYGARATDHIARRPSEPGAFREGGSAMPHRVGPRVILGLALYALVSWAPSSSDAQTSAKPIVLKFSSDTAAQAFYSVGQEWFLAEVEKRSNGRVKFERYWSESLAPGREQLDATSTGVADLAAVISGYWPGKVPLSNVCTLPGLSWDLWPALKAGLEFFNVPEVEAEWTKLNLKVVSIIGTSNYRIMSRMPIQKLDDLKGKKIRSLGLQAELLKALGGVPIGIVAPEVFDALDRGTLDGVAAPPSFVTAFGFHNAAKYYSNLGLGVGGAWPIAMNLGTWNKLPPDIQKIIRETAQAHPDRFARIYQADGDGASLERMKGAGVKTIEAPAADLERIRTTARTQVWEKWAADRNKEGRPGTKVLARWVELVEKYAPESPYAKK